MAKQAVIEAAMRPLQRLRCTRVANTIAALRQAVSAAPEANAIAKLRLLHSAVAATITTSAAISAAH